MEIEVIGKKFGKQIVLIDDEDFHIIEKYNLYIWGSPRHNSLYVIVRLSRTEQGRLHRMIMNPGPKQIVDHINGNCLDNRKSNLRITDSCGNNQNVTKRKNARTSKYKGVHRTPKNRWVAQIQVNKKKMGLGYFDTEKEAATTYNEAATKYFGQFAKLNKID